MGVCPFPAGRISLFARVRMYLLWEGAGPRASCSVCFFCGIILSCRGCNFPLGGAYCW